MRTTDAYTLSHLVVGKYEVFVIYLQWTNEQPYSMATNSPISPERRIFRKNDESGARKIHLHVFETGFPGAMRHLVFGDYLQNHPELAS